MKEKLKINNDKKNMIWNMLGAMSYGFTSLIYLMIVTRINGVEEAGIFTFAFSLACVFFAIGSYSGKMYQITETDKEIQDVDYIYCRFINIFLMIIISILFCIFMKYDFTKFLLIILLTLYRGVDVLSDTFHAIIQRNGYLYKAGISLFVKTLVLMSIFLIINLLFRNMIYASIAILLVELFFCIFIDYAISKKFFQFSKFEVSKFVVLIKRGFFAFCFAFLTSYVLNIPRYILDMLSNNEMQALYGIIVMPSTFLALVATYLIQPYLNKISFYIENNKNKEILNLTYKLTFLMLVLGFIVLCVAYLFGIPVLQLLYSVDLIYQRINLSIIIIGSVLYAIINIYSAVIIALRKSFFQLIILVLTSLISIIFGYYFIYKYFLFGASMTYLFIMAFQLILYTILTNYFLKKDVKK